MKLTLSELSAWIRRIEQRRWERKKSERDGVDRLLEVGRLARIIRQAPRMSPNEARACLGYDRIPASE